jgi:hypothetical protein
MEPNLATLALLREGLEYVKQGWCQYTLYEQRADDGSIYKCCALGALYRAASGGSGLLLPEDHAVLGAVDWLGEAVMWRTHDNMTNGPMTALTDYNDDNGRTQRDIIGIYEEAINLLEGDLMQHKGGGL